jgi:DNA-binding transcriptional regulator YhcF (GntR family)
MLLEQEITHTPSHSLAAELAKEIKGGYLKPGDKLGGLREIAESRRVSLATVRHCFKLLSQDGLIIARHGSGTFVNPALKHSGTKLLGLITTYKRNDIENYYEPLFAVSGENRVIPMVSVVRGAGNWQQEIKDILARDPDGLLLDVYALQIPLDELKQLAKGVPVCFCNRWQWLHEQPENAVLTDYVWAYAEALRMLRERGHERIAIMVYHCQSEPYLLEFLSKAKREAEFIEEDPRLFTFSRDELLTDPVNMDMKLKKFQPTAVFALSDYLIVQLEENWSDATELEKVGFFNLKYSQSPGREFTSFDLGFHNIWSRAIDSFNPPMTQKVEMIRPEPVLRWKK